jgi:hypothetical protein
MIKEQTYAESKEVMDALRARQGGGLFFDYVINGNLETGTLQRRLAAKVPADHKEFRISIYDNYTYTDVVTLVLFVNPRDFTMGQQQILSNTYTRRGWVNAAWGNQQATISISGVSAGFYFFTQGKGGGLTNRYRRGSPAFLNLMDVMGMFKNNGWYFLDGVSNPSLFKDSTSRVINVMDSIKIEYDGSTYIGSFSTLTLNDVAASPYKMEYSFEFIVSSFGLTFGDVDGHIAVEDNYLDNQVHLGIQGGNIGFKTVLGLDVNELNTYFPYDGSSNPTAYDYTQKETDNETEFFNRETEVNSTGLEFGSFKITRGWRDGEGHGYKCDFRTHTGTIYSATRGSVWKRQTSNIYGGSNFIIILTNYNGIPLYVRYFHLNPASIRLFEGMDVEIGTVIGSEGTDNGKYPAHCDMGARVVTQSNANYLDCQEFSVNALLDDMWRNLHGRIIDEPEFAPDFIKLIAKHNTSLQVVNRDITGEV